MEHIKADANRLKRMTRKEVIEYCKEELLNGYYVFQICKNCGKYLTEPEADTENAKIVKVCKYCYDTKQPIMTKLWRLLRR